MKFLIFLMINMISFFNKAQCPVLPSPDVYKVLGNSSKLVLEENIRVEQGKLDQTNFNYLSESFKKYFDLTIEANPSKSIIIFKQLINVPKDYYTIDIHDHITISYGTDASAFYAINSLLQLIETEGEVYLVQQAFLADSPKFEWRGLHLDVSRHFFNVEEIKRYLDYMSFYKFNKFHWHLTDDQGWRIEIKKYPLLTKIGAYRDSTLKNHYTTQPRTFDNKRYGGFYTQEQIKEIVDYAKNKHIEVIPEIEMPGHVRALLAAYPKMSCSGISKNVPGDWGVYEDVLCINKKSIKMMKDILKEVILLFPSKYIHIGGDEVPKNSWHKCSKCQAVIKRNKLKSEEELQSYFLSQISAFLTDNKKTMIGWDEILEGGLPNNAIVMSWRGEKGGIEAAKKGHQVIMSPGSHCYFDHYQSKLSSEPIAIGGYTNLEKVYNYEPIPKALSVSEANFVIGAQANVWTEYMPDFNHVMYMVYPRAIALSEVLWSRNKPNYNDFTIVLERFHFEWMRKMGIQFSKAHLYPEPIVEPILNGVNFRLKANQQSNYNLFVKSDEKYGALNGGMVFSTEDSMYFERTESNKIVNYNFRISSEQIKEPIEFKLKIHPGLNLPIHLETKPSSKYPGQGAFTLVDGLLGTNPWKGSQYLGFDTNNVQLKVSLPTNKKTNQIHISALTDESAWIHQPKTIEIWHLKNNERILFKSLSYVNGFIDISGIENEIEIILIGNSKIEEGKAGAGNVPWMFLDEIIITFQ